MTEAVYQAIGARVRMIRETLGLEQVEVAKRIGMARTSVTNIEAGRQRLLLHQVPEIAQALGVSAKHLMRGIWW